LTTPLILTLDSQGAPVKWVTWQDAVTYETKNAIAWRTGEMTFTFSGGVSRMTGEISKITTSSIIALKGDATRSRWNKALVGVSSKCCLAEIAISAPTVEKDLVPTI